MTGSVEARGSARGQSKAGRPVAILTGGASGIGRSIAEALAKRGTEVVIADRQGEVAQQVADAIRATGGAAQAAEVDVRSAASLQSVVKSTLARSGRLDYFFNNAGIAIAGPIEGYSTHDWDDVIDVNLRGVAYGVQAAYPVMIEQGFGHIVNTASVAGLVAGGGGSASYTASKFGVVGLSKALRIEAAYHGVRVSVLCPGVVRTPLLKGGEFGRMNLEGMSQEWMDAFWEKLHPMDPNVFAQKALAAIDRNKAVIVIPGWWKLAWYFDRFLPGLFLWLATDAFRKTRLELEPTVTKTPIRVDSEASAPPPSP